MSGANNFEDIALWMKERKREIAKFFGKVFKASDYTTVRNTFSRMDSKAIKQLQREWVKGLSHGSEGLTIVATDGKTMRGSKSKEMNQKSRHIVSLFLTDSKLTLTQQAKWNMSSIRNWYEIYPQLSIFFSEIMSKYTK